MSEIDTLDLIARSIGAALAHSLWHGALVAGAAAALLRVLRGATASARYLVACLALAAMTAGWGATAAYTSRALAPLLGATATTAAAAVPLGPAGPLDFTPAIRALPPDALAPPSGATSARDVTWAARLEAWSVAAVPLWLAGVLVLSARLGLAWLVVERLRRSIDAAVPEVLAGQARALADRMRIRRTIRVMQSAAVQVPTVIGWLRPVVLLPMSALSGLSPAQIESIIAHELAHIRRHDYLVNILQSAAEVLLFYHPACWWLSRRIRVEREHCCDDVAIAVCGDRLAYATALADLESLRARPARSPAGVSVDRTSAPGAIPGWRPASMSARSAPRGLALGATDGPLLQRVRRLVAGTDHGSQSSGWAVATVPLAVLALVLGSAQVTSRASTVSDEQTSVPTAARVIPADEGVAEGRVVDSSSARPIVGVKVLLRGSDTSGEATTDADGRFEMMALKPGSYRLSARATGYVEGYYGQSAAMPMDLGAMVIIRGGTVTRGLDIRLQAAGSVSGQVTDAEGKGLAGVEIELLTETPLNGDGRPAPVAFAQTIEDGTYQIKDVVPGDYYVRAYAARDAAAGKNAAVTYASTFYPGVPALEEAQRLRLYSSQELLDVNFPLGTARKVTVSGIVIDPSGDPLGRVRVALHRMGATGGPGSESFSMVDRDGRFEIRDVVPDSYMVNVFDTSLPTSRWVAATRHVTIDADLELELRAELGAHVEGRIVRDPASTRALDASQVSVGFEKAIPGPWGTMTWGGNRNVQDGRFTMETAGGPVTIRVSDVPAGWMLKSISVDGHEIDESPIDLGSGRRQIEVVLTDKISSVSGLVVDRNGRILPNYSVVLFPADPSRRQPSSRFIQSSRSNNTGQFRLDAVPPGDYLAVAVSALPLNAWRNPDVLAKLERGAERVRIAEGERLTISIRASPTPEGVGVRVRPAQPPVVDHAAARPKPVGFRASQTGRKSAAGV